MKGIESLTQELMEVIAKNVEEIGNMVNDEKDADSEGKGSGGGYSRHKNRRCCCPDKVEFDIEHSIVVIVNDNAACPSSHSSGHCS